MSMETAGKIAALLIVGIVAVGLLIIAFQEAAPQPYLPLVNAEAQMWIEIGPAPPQYCPSPYPICTGPDCQKPRSVA